MNEKIEYKFIYTPFDQDFPIKQVVVHIVAKTRKEAELIAMDRKWTFFNQSLSCCVLEVQE